MKALILITFFLFLVILYTSWIVRGDLNDKRQCMSCKVVSREGIWYLYNSNLNQGERGFSYCPVCNSQYGSMEVYQNAPLAPRLSTLGCHKIRRAVSKNESNIQATEQLDAYLSVQNKRLNQMKNTIEE